MHEEFDLIGADGTRLTAWRNGTVDGPPVLICNGMGVPPEAWPRLLDAECEFTVVGWNHRGALGSDRPADPTRIDITDHADDAIALMDHLGWDKAVVVAWSLGVNVAFELAGRPPGPGQRSVVGGGGTRRHLRHPCSPLSWSRGHCGGPWASRWRGPAGPSADN